MHIHQKGKVWEVRFQLEYVQRESLSEEEILEEGFTGEDDFEWTGILPEVWVQVLDRLLKATEFKAEQPEEALNHLFLEYTNNGKSGFPTNFSDWEYMLEELIQAIYELAKREHPFFLKLINTKQGIDLQLHAKFATRSFVLKGNKRPFPWEQLKTVLGQIENLDINEVPKAKAGKKGYWLTFDNEQFFEIRSE
eukprot:CAMPEP_0119088280 /NCGR_PEP_ID=MMETSP1178-20130426/144867_1 /TAXON_ID=33656 /ORGANISM="unid sp, Strain CCMP2000" /LENGTH=193 /DNA_ID=CAMNT_0007071553 /DNA_START=47 /DNA_END=625 /DNA_ORIENTATION=+